jgi:hypothetical protein
MRYQHGAAPTLCTTHSRACIGWSAAAIVAVLMLLAGCSTTGAGAKSTTSRALAANHHTTPTAATSTAIGGGSYVQITDLNSFREQLSAAFTQKNWSKVAQFLSPAFSFQGLDSGGNRMIMPDSAADFDMLYKSQGPWSQASLYEVQIHFCDAGNTPINQQLGFDGNGGSFILMGIDRWQGVWLVSWSFQDPNGGGDACASA